MPANSGSTSNPHSDRFDLFADSLPYAVTVDDFRATLDLAPIGLAQFDDDGRFLMTNERLRKILGLSQEELLGCTFQQIVFPDDVRTCRAANTALAAGAIPQYQVERRFVHPDGSALWARVRVSAVRPPHTSAPFFFAIVEDICDERAERQARSASLDRMSAAIAASGIATYRWYFASNAIEWSENINTLFGIGERNISGGLSELLERVHEDDLQRVVEAVKRCVIEGADFEEEYRVVLPDGSVRWLLSRGRTTCDQNQVPTYLTGACVDVTGSKMEQNALRQREELLRRAFEIDTLGVVYFNMAGEMTAMNRASRRLCGTADYDFTTPVPMAQLIHPESQRHFRHLLEELKESGRSPPFEIELVRPDGSRGWALVTATRISEENGVAFIVDITDRKIAERTVRESEAKLRRISESGVIGVFYCKRDGAIVDANDKFLSMLGYTREDVAAGRLHADRLTPERWAALDEIKAAEVAATGSASAWEKEFYASDGRVVPVIVAAAGLEADDSPCVLICLDITKRRAAEKERERLLGREHAERERAERAIRLRDDVLAVVAHDLRNPLNTIRLSASALSDKSLSEVVRDRQLVVIDRVIEDMNELIGNLLDVARMDTGTFPIEKTRVNLHELLDRTLAGFELQTKERQITLERLDLCEMMHVLCDPIQLGRVFSNLVGNAIKFTPPSGQVVVRSERINDCLEITVEDNGPGISADDLPHIFDRFWKAHHTSRLGVGLGLAIAKGIVESHGGRIWAESEQGRGAAFHFTLPA